MKSGKRFNDVNIRHFYWSFSERRRGGKQGSERESLIPLKLLIWFNVLFLFLLSPCIVICTWVCGNLFFRNLHTSAQFGPSGKCPWSARVSDDCIAVCSKPLLLHVLRFSLVFKFLIQGKTISAGSKHINGSKERYLLEQDKTSNSLGLSPLSNYKTTLKQQLNGQKRWKMKWKAKLSPLMRDILKIFLTKTKQTNKKEKMTRVCLLITAGLRQVFDCKDNFVPLFFFFSFLQ